MTNDSQSDLFGICTSPAEAKLHLLAVPWEVTTSYGRGTALGPQAILRASSQVDLFDLETGDAWRSGYYLEPISEEWLERSNLLKEKALERLELMDEGGDKSEGSQTILAEINRASEELNAWVEAEATKKLAQGKVVAVIGGDHSSPYGLIKAVHTHTKGDFGILHIDAHADLRVAYQGYKHSHASIMYNVMQDIGPKTLVQVGIRDFCREEFDYSESKRGQMFTHYDRIVKRKLEAGESWQSLAKSMISTLPKNVYVSFDIDGLEPSLCPSTGTPVPGGLTFDQATSLFVALADAGKRIVGFDLNEVAEPEVGAGEWDANVGARMLFRMCAWTAVTNGWAERRL